MTGMWFIAILLSVNATEGVPQMSGRMLNEYTDKATCDREREKWMALKTRDEAIWDEAMAMSDFKLLERQHKQKAIAFSVSPCWIKPEGKLWPPPPERPR